MPLNQFLRAATAGAVLVFALAPLAQAQPGGDELEGKPIVAISFSGLQKLTPDAVKALMVSKEGTPFSRDVLDQDVKRLAGYSPPKRESEERRGIAPRRGQPAKEEDSRTPVPKVFNVIPSVFAELNPEGTGVVIRITAVENQRVAGLVFLGAVAFDRKELLPLIRTRAGNLVDDFTLELDRQELLRHYKEKGYHYAEVSFSKTTEKYGELIIFTITEGAEVTIRSVEFRGLQSFSKNELLKEMPFTEEPGLLSSKEFVLEQVRRDVVQLNLFYRNRGFLDAQVTLLEWQPTPDHEKVDLVIEVEEGQPYTVGSVKVRGMTLFDPAEITKDWRTQPGLRYEPGFALQRDMQALEDRYQRLGYIEVKVENESGYGLAKDEVEVVVAVTEGALVYTGEIIVQGNQDTQDRIARREMRVHTGEPLDLQALLKSKQAIRRLGYWEVDGVQTATPPIPVQEFQIYRDAYTSLRDTERENVKDIVVTLKEADTGSLRFAAGVTSNLGVLGDITYTKTNFDPLDLPESFSDIFDAFTGGGQFVVLSFQPGTRFTRARAAWGNPRIFDSPYLVVGEIYYTTFIRENWDEQRFGGSLRIGRELTEDLRADLTLRNELVTVTNIDHDAPQLVFDFEGENEVVSATLDLRLTKLEYQPKNLVDPIGGYMLTLGLEHAGLWGDIEFNKAVLSGEKYIHLWQDGAERDHVLQLKGSIGIAGEFGDTRDIPVYERFFAGGAGSIRGFRFRGVGPHDNDSPIGGKALWTAGVEYAYPLIGDAIRGVVFVDTGSVGLDWGDPELGRVRMGGGVGLRVVIPFLGDRPVAVDFGIPILREREDRSQLLSFSFGRNF